MNYRDFGNSGLRSSEFVFGCGAVGGLMIRGDDDTRRRAVTRALEVGVNWFDTAASYGDGQSEQALGWLLEEVDPAPHVSTKFSLDPDSRQSVRTQILGSLERSLERLRRDSVTLLQLHNPIASQSHGRLLGVDDVMGEGGVLDVLADLKQSGRIELGGITGLGEPEAVKRVVASARVDSVQVYFNLLNPTAAFPVPTAWRAFEFGNLLATCAEHGVATMNIRVFSAGVIATDARTGRERPLTTGDTVESETLKAATMFERIGDRFGSRAQTALRFALAEPRLSCVVAGLADLGQLEEAIQGFEAGPLDASEMDEVRSVYAAFED